MAKIDTRYTHSYGKSRGLMSFLDEVSSEKKAMIQGSTHILLIHGEMYDFRINDCENVGKYVNTVSQAS